MKLIGRLLSQTPVFFQKIRNICLAVGGAAAVVMMLPNYPDLSEWFHTAMEHCAVAGGIGAFISQLSKHETPSQ